MLQTILLVHQMDEPRRGGGKAFARHQIDCGQDLIDSFLKRRTLVEMFTNSNRKQIYLYLLTVVIPVHRWSQAETGSKTIYDIISFLFTPSICPNFSSFVSQLFVKQCLNSCPCCIPSIDPPVWSFHCACLILRYVLFVLRAVIKDVLKV